jgi:hypothetical protein
MKHLIVSVYEEDISWLKSIDFADEIFIYNKGNKFIVNSIKLPNIGREAHTFIYHIVKNYNNLPDFLITLQGCPFPHLRDINIDNINQVYKEYDYLKDKHSFHELLIDSSGLTKLCYSKYFENTPDVILFSPGAQWIVSKKIILSKSLNFYTHVLYELMIDRKSSSDGVVNAWTMEGLWNYIFDETVKEKTSFS